jgi:transcriptional regulator with GAF, ATPase, and Fis domain
VLKQAENVASTDSVVLICGETGTGKELIARTIHDLSKRRNLPMVKLNCAALPPTLIESELFGREKGAYTDALTKEVGRLELANHSTIFLDAISELPFELQVKLLRILQEGEFERLGNPKAMKVNVRVIAATNRNLPLAIEKKEFREDLYYRLNVFPISCPPLRERKEDIPLLVQHFLQKFEGKMGKTIEMVAARVMKELVAYDWPGNIRELENLIERAMILNPGNVLEWGEWLPVTNLTPKKEKTKTPSRTLSDIEREHIIETLKKVNWRVSGEKGAAKLLGLNPTTLDARIKKLGIKREE